MSIWDLPPSFSDEKPQDDLKFPIMPLPKPPVFCPKCKAEVSAYQRGNGLIWCPWCDSIKL